MQLCRQTIRKVHRAENRPKVQIALPTTKGKDRQRNKNHADDNDEEHDDEDESDDDEESYHVNIDALTKDQLKTRLRNLGFKMSGDKMLRTRLKAALKGNDSETEEETDDSELEEDAKAPK